MTRTTCGIPLLDCRRSAIIGRCSGYAASAGSAAEMMDLLADTGRPLAVIADEEGPRLVADPRLQIGMPGDAQSPAVHAWLPAVPVTELGDADFRAAHGLRYAYMAGAMANGIASAELCISMARAGMLGSYGAGGQSLERIRAAITTIKATIGTAPFAVNLIHSPHEPAHEEAVVDLLIEQDVRLAEASAYLDLTPAAVRYRLHGLRVLPDGSVQAPNRIIAKASRVEVASRWMSPAPARILTELVQRGAITQEQARMAEHLPLAPDLTAEADSGGHTDRRPAISLYPTMLHLAERLAQEHGYQRPVRIGAAGGIATPAAAAAAFGMGVAYCCTGSINQACVESGSCDHVRSLLAQVDQADVTMAPAADMFEMGVQLQVVKRGTMFAMRAQRLWELYSHHPAWEAIPAAEREKLERSVFKRSFADIWRDTEAFWQRREPAQAERARTDAKRRLALCFRWYLGLSSHWANTGEAGRELDYQIWAGPAMGAFNEWTRDSALAEPSARRADLVARNLLHGAALHLRLSALRSQGVAAHPRLATVPPRSAAELDRWSA
ncbi:MAG: PfaD family polyunsaturated fatty acid/polyketide biosynthesis protein [Planctomycetota bacterium]